MVFTKTEEPLLMIVVPACPNAMKTHHVVASSVGQTNLCLMEQFWKDIAAGGGKGSVRQQQSFQPIPKTIYGHAKNNVSMEIKIINKFLLYLNSIYFFTEVTKLAFSF